MRPTIDPRVRVGAVTLTVADLGRSVRYYQRSIGLRLLNSGIDQAVLGANETPLIYLHSQPGARQVRGVTGLYHYALLVPSRRELARTIKHLAETDTLIDGASDHLVSEALYLSDPDGHGIEIYRDRPREQWYDDGGIMEMATLPLDFEAIMGELGGQEDPWKGIHSETVMGHVHLHVADLNESDHFYMDLMGFEKPALTVSIPTASFVSAGGYHHHLGLNIWAGRGAPPPPEDAAQLVQFEILFPDEQAINQVVRRLSSTDQVISQVDSGWTVHDPSQNSIHLRLMSDAGRST